MRFYTLLATPESQMHPLNPAGSVSISIKNGRIRLRLPRSLYGGQQKYLYLGMQDSPQNQTAAKKIAHQIELDILAGYFDPTLEKYKPRTYGNGVDLQQLWAEFTTYKAKTLEPSTIQRDFGKVAARLAKVSGNADPLAVRNYLIKNFSQEVARRTLQAISRCMDWAVMRGEVEANPYPELIRDLRPTKGTQRSRQAFSLEEVEVILCAVGDNRFCSKYAPLKHDFYLNFFRFLTLTACRPEEATALNWKHVRSDHIFFCEAIPSDTRIRGKTKTGVSREFPINKQLKALLATIPRNSPEAPVFASRRGLTLDEHNVLNRVWKPVVGTLVEGGEVRQYLPIYNLRHTTITHWIQKGIPLHQIAYWVGNSPEVLLKHYASVIEGLLPPEL